MPRMDPDRILCWVFGAALLLFVVWRLWTG